MSKSDRNQESTNNVQRCKPNKPYKDFPLTPHKNGQWCKKVRGKIHYFGKWDDWQGALKCYQEQKDDLEAGRTPRVKQEGGLTIREMLNRFLTAKKGQLKTGDITHRSFFDYFSTATRIGDTFGLNRLVDDLDSLDFEKLRVRISETRGPVALGNEVNRVRVVFNYAYEAGLIDNPMRYGPTFKRPSKKTIRLERAKKGERMFEPSEIKQMLDAASPTMRAMIFLGVNCGFGNQDVGTLEFRHVDLDGGWIDFPRPKTGIQRRCPLWPETITAIREAIESRPKPKSVVDQEMVFLTKYGGAWAKYREPQIADAEQPEKVKMTMNPLSMQMRKLLQQLGLYKKGLNFYALRHVAETIGGESRDQVAVDHILGHSRDDMASVYRERISDERLLAVTEHVRKWLFD